MAMPRLTCLLITEVLIVDCALNDLAHLHAKYGSGEWTYAIRRRRSESPVSEAPCAPGTDVKPNSYVGPARHAGHRPKN